jgi:branched-chain amino acid transport system permease protein
LIVAALLTSMVTGVAIGSTYALLAVGFVIIYRATEVVNFAQPALVLLGTYFASVLVVSGGLPFAVAVPLAMLIVAAIAAVTERVALRPLVGQPVFSAAMVTVGVFIVLLMVVSRLLGPGERVLVNPWGLQQVTYLGLNLYSYEIPKIVISLAAIGAVGLFLHRSRIGLAMRATSLDQETALAQGVNVGRMFGMAWALAGALAALAGVLLSAGAGVFTVLSWIPALKALPVMILGGIDSIKGSVVAGLIIGVAEALTRTYQPVYATWLGANFDVIVPYLIMTVVLMFRPHGLFGTAEVQRV